MLSFLRKRSLRKTTRSNSSPHPNAAVALHREDGRRNEYNKKINALLGS